MSDREASAARKQSPDEAPRSPLAVVPDVASTGEADAVADTFEKRLTREILISERLRVTLLALIPGLSMLAFLAVSALRPDLVQKAFHAQLDRLRIGLFLGGISAYEFYSLRNVEKLIESGRKPPALRRYVNALLEMSVPTVVILYYMSVVGPVDALLLPPTWTYFVFILLSTLRLEFMLCVFSGVVASVEYGIVAFAAVTASAQGAAVDPVLASIPHHLGKAAILLVSGIAAGFVARRLRMSFVNTLRSIEDKNRIVGVFGQHVSPAVVERLIAAGEGAKSELRDVCVMFVDIRNFTAFSEDKTPQEVVDYLNSLFDLLLGAVNEHNGIVNKFLGDGFMAIFGAPIAEGNHCRNAIKAALAMNARIDAEVKARRLAPTRIGVGVHAGKAVVGNIGSRQRKEYTVIGDVVNVASRVEALNKELGSQILVTEEVWKAGGGDGVLAVPKAPLPIRGRKAQIQVYQLA